MSPELLKSLSFRYLKWKFGLNPSGSELDDSFEAAGIIRQLNAVKELEAAVVLAFDAVYELDGTLNESDTHLMTENDCVAVLAERQPKVLFGASIHPYRKDAIAELERCVARGAVLVKWLPITQGIDPSHPKCFPFYGEHSGPLQTAAAVAHGGRDDAAQRQSLRRSVAASAGMRRGVTVLAAHCGTRSVVGHHDYLKKFARMAVWNTRTSTATPPL